jgi:pimeloyl-ACP methyl ester carboxylesterase
MGVMTGVKQYTDRHWMTADGLKLHYRDYAGPKSRPPILCIPGLTRNARDFSALAQRLAGDWRVICVELRGRGDSAYAKDVSTYSPLSYVADLELLIAALKLKRLVIFGSSLGGILTMLLTASKPGRVQAALINDIGPDMDPRGLGRIKGHLGKSQSWPTWVHAARWMSETQGHAFPSNDLVDWVAFAKRVCRLSAQGRVVLDYDMAIAEPLREETAPFDLWPLVAALGDTPVTLLRGALSDMLTEATAKRMTKMLPFGRLVTVQGVGHAPMLDEPEAVRAIDALLKRAIA